MDLERRNNKLTVASVVVPTRNRPRHLRHTLATLANQDCPHPYEVIVVDNGSDRSVVDVVRSVASEIPDRAIRYVREDRRGTNIARNTGARLAESQLIVFVDDDVDAPEAWLSEVVSGTERHPEARCFGGPIRLRLLGSPPRLCGREPLGETELDLGDAERRVEAVWGANMAVRRSAFDETGPFDESLPIYHEEVEWEQRLRQTGGSIVYLPKAWLWHRKGPEELRLRALVIKRFRFGYGNAAVVMRNGELPSIKGAIGEIPRLIGHSVKRRCWWGVMQATQQVGFAYGLIRHREGTRR